MEGGALGLGLALGAEGEEFLRGVESSTCLLLATPTPPEPDADAGPLHPLHALAPDACDCAAVQLQGEGDSSSSGDSNSVTQDPVSAQLINNISMMDYQTLSKATDLIIGQDAQSKLNGSMNLGNRKLPNFVNWNWTIVRKVLLWVVLSALIACCGVIIAMIATLPRSCNPDLPWYQGKVFYEVFPASFENSNNDGFGDLKGLLRKIDYIQDLGAVAIRLNYIFEAPDYPEHFANTSNLLSIDRNIGTMNDFQELVTEIHKRNMSLVLDIPVTSMGKTTHLQKKSSNASLVTSYAVDSEDALTPAITFWSSVQHVDGFYLKGLENFADNPYFGSNLQHWKQIIGYNKILIVSEETLNKTTGNARTILLSRVDLIDVYLNMTDSPNAIKQQINGIISGPLWSKPSNPWVHWNVGNVNSQRLASKNVKNALPLLILELVLPGTISIFYGDEIALPGLEVKEIDFHEHAQVHNLVLMKWSNSEKTRGGILPWNSNSDIEPHFTYLNALKQLIDLRINTPTLYLNSINKEGKMYTSTQIRDTDTEKDLVIIERWYPRRNSYVVVANLGDRGISTDLSSMFYGGIVVASTNLTAVGNFIYFDQIVLAPHFAIAVKLDK